MNVSNLAGLGTMSGGAGDRAPQGEDDLRNDLARVLRLLVTAIDAAEDGAIELRRDSPLVTLARSLVFGGERVREMARTSNMALRDLVWRVDTARALLEMRCQEEDQRSELRLLLATDDIHDFLHHRP